MFSFQYVGNYVQNKQVGCRVLCWDFPCYIYYLHLLKKPFLSIKHLKAFCTDICLAHLLHANISPRVAPPSRNTTAMPRWKRGAEAAKLFTVGLWLKHLISCQICLNPHEFSAADEFCAEGRSSKPRYPAHRSGPLQKLPVMRSSLTKSWGLLGPFLPLHKHWLECVQLCATPPSVFLFTLIITGGRNKGS